ncbi:hypothetical protein KGQ19_11290 [Catenulispora sp. NL8]|uniref:Secreted protein/lipoprotein n=1 Tax=Catenulispora pinistramenti TaxID=2705254 RepID=A0ABS5KN25_9ACTN|nr:hypothetical protein [Catenulispora pinistramenti]MBS2547456.1 hypothetical protein [Catenulispora pinistramenti]
MAGKHVGRVALVVYALVTVLTASCGSSMRPSPHTPASAPSSILPTDPVSIASRNALAAYDGMMADWTAVSKTSNYQDPILTRHTSGDALSKLVRTVAAAQAAGVVSKGRPADSPRVVKLTPQGTPTEAILADCADASTWLQFKTDGTQIPGVGGRHAVDVQVDDIDGVWKVSKFVFHPAGTC